MRNASMYRQVVFYKIIGFLSISLFLSLCSCSDNGDSPIKSVPPVTPSDVPFVSNYDRTIFVDSNAGNDSNDGLSMPQPIRSIGQLNQMGLKSGDEILFKGGETYPGMIALIGIDTKENTKEYGIHIGHYGDSIPTISFHGHEAGIYIQNTSSILIDSLAMTNDGDKDNTHQRYGIRLLSTSTNSGQSESLVQKITIRDVSIHDIFSMALEDCKSPRFCRQWDMADSSGWGWGIFAEVKNGKGIQNVHLQNTNIRNVSHTGIKFRGNAELFKDVLIENCQILDTGGPGIQFNRINDATIQNNHIARSGSSSDIRKWARGSGMWTYRCKDILIAHNIFESAEGIADCCGAHIDVGNQNVVLEYNLSRKNAGGFIEILGGNQNCSYRYNVSVDDGWRDLNDPAQVSKWGTLGLKGCIVSINGFGGGKSENDWVGPFNTYVYNNTIVVTQGGNAPYTNPCLFGFATSIRGLLFANNIVWVYRKMTTPWSDHTWLNGEAKDRAYDFRISTGKSSTDKVIVSNLTEQQMVDLNIVCTNNLYQISDELPNQYWDLKPIYGNPSFVNVNGMDMADFVPVNKTVINQGIKISKLDCDDSSDGLIYGGLEVDKDIMGSKITTPMVGAIVSQ